MPTAPPTDEGAVAALVAQMPCFYRRHWGTLITNGPAFGLFPWKGQNVDTPVGVSTKWTTDDQTHPIP